MDYELNVWINFFLKATQCKDPHWKKEALEIIINNIESLVKDKEIVDDRINAKTFIRDDKKEITVSFNKTYTGK